VVYDKYNVSIFYRYSGSIVPNKTNGRRGRGRMVVGFTTTYVTSAYYH